MLAVLSRTFSEPCQCSVSPYFGRFDCKTGCSPKRKKMHKNADFLDISDTYNGAVQSWPIFFEISAPTLGGVIYVKKPSPQVPRSNSPFHARIAKKMLKNADFLDISDTYNGAVQSWRIFLEISAPTLGGVILVKKPSHQIPRRYNPFPWWLSLLMDGWLMVVVVVPHANISE